MSKIDNTKCPVCGSEDITGAQLEVDVGIAWQPVSCQSCLSDWHDIFHIREQNILCNTKREAVICAWGEALNRLPSGEEFDDLASQMLWACPVAGDLPAVRTAIGKYCDRFQGERDIAQAYFGATYPEFHDNLMAHGDYPESTFHAYEIKESPDSSTEVFLRVWGDDNQRYLVVAHSHGDVTRVNQIESKPKEPND